MIKKVFVIMMFLGILGGCSACSNEQFSMSEEYVCVETPYVTLKYPSKWENVEIEVSDGEICEVSFFTKEQALFDLILNGDKGEYLGVIKDKNITVRVVFYELENDYANDPSYVAMQEDINVILGFLASDYSFSIEQCLEREEINVFEIETALTSLYYPTRWKSQTKIEIEDTYVRFSFEETPLFALNFENKSGYYLGAYKTQEIYLELYEIDPAEYSDTEYEMINAMQEDVNVILQHLMEDKNFTLAN